MELPKSIKDRIEKESANRYSKRHESAAFLSDIASLAAEQHAWERGATWLALRSTKLVEALEEIADKSDKNSTAYIIAKYAIQEYRQP